jgi:TIR domain
MQPENPKVFISHAGEDKERFVLDFATKLRIQYGIDAKVDRWEVRPGDSLVNKIFDEMIGKADAVIAILSEYSINKPWVREELNVSTVRQIEDGIRLIPVVIGEVEKHQIPTSLRDTVWVRVSDLNEYAAELSEVADTVYGRQEKPPLGQQPEYTRTDLGVVPDLTPSDSVVLKLCCEMEIESGRRKAIVDPAAVIEQAERMDLYQDQIVESMEILDGRGYVRSTHTMGSKMPYSLSVTNFGFDKYARTYMPGYHSLIRAVGFQLVNHEEYRATAIAEAVDAPIVIVEHILEMFEANGFVGFVRETGPLYISSVSPELRRWLQET